MVKVWKEKKMEMMARLTCMADNVDKKSLHCSSTTLSVAVTLISSDTNKFISSTCKWQVFKKLP